MRAASIALVCVIAWYLVLTPGTIWSLWKTLENVYRSIHQSKSKLCSLKKNDRISGIEFTMICSGLGCAFFASALITSILTTSIHLYIMIRNRNLNIPDSLAKEPINSLRWIILIEQLFGFICLIITYCERLAITFDNTEFMLNRCTVTSIRYIIGLGLLCFLMALAVGELVDGQIGVLIFLPALLSYCALAFWISIRFTKSTYRLATQFNGSLNDRTGRDLVDVALKLTILTTVSNVSTTISGLQIISTAFYRTGMMIVFRSVLFSGDSFLNALCLCLAFKKSSVYYDYVFGAIHKRVMKWLLPGSDITTSDDYSSKNTMYNDLVISTSMSSETIVDPSTQLS